MFHERTFVCGNFTLNGVTGPESGPPMVFLHGVTRRWQDFLTLMPSVVPRWSTVAFDFRGHGRSDRAPRYLLKDHLDDAIAFMSLHVKEPAVLYGHSLGALVAAGIAAAMPDRVRAVILEDPPAESLLKNIRASVYHTLFRIFQSFCDSDRSVAEVAKDLGGYLMPMPGAVSRGPARDAVQVRFMARCLKECDPETLTPVIESRWLDGYDSEAIFRNVKCPALLFRADESVGGMLAKSPGEQLARWMPDCTAIDWTGTGHLIHWLQPEATAKYVTGFLESL